MAPHSTRSLASVPYLPPIRTAPPLGAHDCTTCPARSSPYRHRLGRKVDAQQRFQPLRSPGRVRPAWRRCDGIALVSLQKGRGSADIADYFDRAPLLNLGRPKSRDFDDTMAIIETLDLVVTVDTSVAHLAGAMGKPVWILLPHAPDWRWLLERNDSPWYPTARLFRQSRPRDWGGVAHRLVEAWSGFPLAATAAGSVGEIKATELA